MNNFTEISNASVPYVTLSHPSLLMGDITQYLILRLALEGWRAKILRTKRFPGVAEGWEEAGAVCSYLATASRHHGNSGACCAGKTAHRSTVAGNHVVRPHFTHNSRLFPGTRIQCFLQFPSTREIKKKEKKKFWAEKNNSEMTIKHPLYSVFLLTFHLNTGAFIFSEYANCNRPRGKGSWSTKTFLKAQLSSSGMEKFDFETMTISGETIISVLEKKLCAVPFINLCVKRDRG